MGRPIILIHDVLTERASWIRENLIPFVDKDTDFVITRRGCQRPSTADLVVLGDPTFAPDGDSHTGRNAVVKARYTLTREAWRVVAAIPWSATVAVSAASWVMTTLGDALGHLQRSDIRLVPLAEARTPDQGSYDCYLRVIDSHRKVGPVREGRINIPRVSPGFVVDALWQVGRLNCKTYLAVREYLNRIEPLPEDMALIIDHLIASNACLDKTLTMSRQVALKLDGDGRVIDAAGIPEALLGRRAERLLGHVLRDICPELGGLDIEAPGVEQKVVIDGHLMIARSVPIEGTAATGRGSVVTLTLLEKHRAVRPLRAKQYSNGARYCLADIIGTSEAIERVRRLALRVSKSDASILIIGESGTGKELFVQAMHNVSPRAWGPFIPINCAAIPESLIESELFGYEGGAFTGAQQCGRPSLFERADHGTVFLDELGDMSPRVQAALLRVLEEGVVTRVGGNRSIAVDVRIMGAVSRPLDDLVTKGHFRRDLYHRLCVIPIYIPALRERVGDIAVLARHLLMSFGDHRCIPQDVMCCMLRYRWPGNVRELRHCIEYMINVADGEFTLDDLPPHILPHVAIANERRFEEGAPAAMPFGEENAASDTQLNTLDLFILQALAVAHREGRGLGRRMLTKEARCQGFNASEREIRARLQALKLQGLLHWGRGRRGATLTSPR